MPDRPNFFIIVADDLGYSDIGSYGGEIYTPNIDSLASDNGGQRFTSFHVAAACSPTRAMLMTGTDHHLTGLGQLAEMVRNSPAHQGKPGHEGYLTDRVAAMPELLRDGGYYTMMAGKWHLGLKPEYGPKARGFDRSFSLLPGCANHYAFEPDYEKVEEPPRFFETAVTALHAEDGQYINKLPEDFYSSDAFASKLIQYLDERSVEEKEKPLFAYLPFSAPHWPLQAPKESMDKYRGMYDDGPDALRLRRLHRLKELGLLDPNIVPHEIVAVGREQGHWNTLTDYERAKSARSMEAYAGMVDRMDHNIGRILDSLKASGEYDNTYILFMSDNGAEGASYEARDMIREDILTHIAKYYDNSLDNIGRANSFVWYGNRWAQAATAPSRLYKMFSTQGGCHVPLVVKPAVQQKNDRPSGNAIIPAFCTVQDILPTLLDLAGLQHPAPNYRGREILPMRGKSWKDFLSSPSIDDVFAIHGPDHATGFECAGSGALRRGRYKITYVPAPHGPQRWELFDIEDDPGETKDISAQQPEEFEALLKLWEEYKNEVGVVGVREELGDGSENAFKDDFEDVGRVTRWIGKEDVPEHVKPKFW
ncbi:uncharacterized protein LTR77_002341 [Saxophila tyrrhenica]|uniref:Sulfatase N-terminal domain-containing protein n=1 Tax=Saxophila tyrrhenica TaxID=1690608 RepID=A0AAV9PIX1_9PEZI|nr:hypothetical protein LTR77_002341 [Saxophila tyrrhenica]